MSKPVILSASPDILKRNGLTETVAVWEDGLRADTGRGTFEWWYFDAHFDDGSTAVVVFSTKPLLERNGPLKPNISLTITRPDGTKAARFPLFPPGQFSAAKEACDVRIGSNRAQGDLHRYEVRVEMDGLAVDLNFTGIVPPWRPGAGKAYFGDLDHYFAWLPSIPYGTVEGMLTYDGQIHTVKGTGYHDHNWGNVGLNEVMDHWYWGRAHLGDYTLIYVEQIASATYGWARMPVFMLAKGDKILTDTGEALKMEARNFIEHADGRGYPREVDFDWQGGAESVHLRLREPKIIEAASLLMLLPKWQQRIARLFANPYYFRFNADLELEINLKNTKARERGPALYEIMILQGKKHP
jgi:hypothetical protein